MAEVSEQGPPAAYEATRYFPAEYDTLTADECVGRMWETCCRVDEDGWVTFDGGSDQWFVMIAECPHGKFKGASRGQADPSNAFRHLLHEFTKHHA